MKQRMRAIVCRDLPELYAWRDQPFLKDALLEETGGGEPFVARATQTLLHQAFLAPLSAPPGSRPSPLKRLLNQGYTPEQIARAFAEAWLRDDENLYLPRLRLADHQWVRNGIPVLAAVATVVVLGFDILVQSPENGAAFVYLSGFLAIPAVLLAWLYGRLWRAVLRWFNRER